MKKLVLLPVLFAWLVSLQSCIPFGKNPEFVNVESEPPGAAVIVMGEKIGVTPLMVRQDAVFPLTYDFAKRDQYGTIVLWKEGCKEHKQRVSTSAYGEGIKAKLDCGETRPEVKSETAGREPESVERRLRRIKELHEKGLITDEEEKAARKRICDAL